MERLFLNNLSPQEIITLAWIISISLKDDLTVEELFAVGTFLISIGTLTNNMAVQLVLIRSQQPTDADNEIKELKNEVQKLKNDLQNLDNFCKCLNYHRKD